MRIMAILLLLLSVSVGSSGAAFVTAAHLLETCKSFSAGEDYNNPDERICSGYVMGVHDTAKSYEKLYNSSPLYCEPPRVTSDQMILAVKRYLLQHPELLQGPASPRVIDAFAQAFPCH